ncbi:MAG TPA: type II toxin-antitoxin system VapC family toxin [Longimicrobiales bacterium]|nr:type II toxin-antitoxin system VapC family toxin [Longimicrobiales bacterium]
MIFVDTNVFMYAVGRDHPLRAPAREFFLEHVSSGEVLVSSSEVLQELLHAYIPVDRLETLDAALTLARARLGAVWPLEVEDVELARELADRHAGLGARDLVHVACCKRRGVTQVKTFDRALAAQFS